MKKQTLQVLLAYLTIYIVWGSTYFFISLSVETVPPLLVVGLRFTVGGLLLFALAAGSRRGIRWPTPRQTLSSLLMGSLLLLLGNNLITIAERKVDSYLVALILACVPLQVAFFDRLLFGKRLAAVRLIGILVGVAGVGLLLYDGRSLAGSLTLETWLVIISGLLWSFGTSLGHRLPLPEDNRVNSGLQMLLAGVVSLAVVLAMGVSPLAALAGVSARSLVGVSYLAVVGSLAFAAFTFLVANEPAIRVVSYSLVNPGIAVLLGLLIGHEQPVPYLFAGLPLILAGLAVMLYGEALLGRIRVGRRDRTHRPERLLAHGEGRAQDLRQQHRPLQGGQPLQPGPTAPPRR